MYVVLSSEKKLMVRTIVKRMQVTVVRMWSILSRVDLSQVQSHTSSALLFKLRMRSATSLTLYLSLTFTFTSPIGTSLSLGMPAISLKVSKDTPISGSSTTGEYNSPILFEKTDVYLRGILLNPQSQYTLTLNYLVSPSKMPNCCDVSLLMVQVIRPSGEQRQEQGSQGGCASVLMTDTFQQKKVLMRFGDTAQIRLSTNYILALSEISTSLNPSFFSKTCRRYKLTQAQSSTPSIPESISLYFRLSISPVTTIQLPFSFSSSMYIVCNWICKPTDTNTMKATERAQRIAVPLFLNLWQDRFFRVRMKSVVFAQKRQRYAVTFSRKYCTLKARIIRPISSPSRIMKNITRSTDRFEFMSALGRRQQIIRPKDVAIPPKITLPKGNSLPSMQVSILVASVLFLKGLRFSARSLRITLHIGAIEATMGTKTPMKRPPTTAQELGLISYRYPKKSQNTEDTIQRAPQARGYASKLAPITYLREPVRILATMKSRFAPITFRRAKSKFLLSIPTLNILFIISTLRRKRENISSWNVTPRNIPTNFSFTRFYARGMQLQTEKRPIFYSNFLPKLLTSMKLYSQFGFEYTSTLSGRFTVAYEANYPKEKFQDEMQDKRGEFPSPAARVRLIICWMAQQISKYTN